MHRTTENAEKCTKTYGQISTCLQKQEPNSKTINFSRLPISLCLPQLTPTVVTNVSLLRSRIYPKTYHLPFSGPRSWPGDFLPPFFTASFLDLCSFGRTMLLHVEFVWFALTMWYNGRRSVSFHFRFADWWSFARNLLVVHLKKKKLLVWPWGLIFCLCFCLFVCVVFFVFAVWLLFLA